MMSKTTPSNRLRAPTSKGSRWKLSALWEPFTFVLFVAPNLLLFSVFTFWPILFTFYLSFTDWNFIRASHSFVGWENYTDLLTSPLFHKVVVNTLIYAFGTVFVQLAIALFLALLLEKPLWGRTLFRTAIFLPHVTTTAAVAVVWIFILDPDYGLLSAGLSAFGVTSPRWLGDPDWALFSIILVTIWKSVGFSTVIYLAGLSSLDTELQEAARVDGASELQVFRFITFPLLTPITFFLVITGIIGAIQAFDIPAVMTGGGPVNATKVYAYYLYELAFQQFKAGSASALAMIFFVVIIAITFVQLKLARRWVHQPGAQK